MATEQHSSAVKEHLDVSYDPQDTSLTKYHTFDFYVPDTHVAKGARKIIVFVHGGAWRAEDKADHRDLARRLVSATHLPVAVPNYRLTSTDPHSPLYRLQHPAHAADILRFLDFLAARHGPDGSSETDGLRLILVGHSCSAHMLSAILLDSSDVTSQLTPSPEVLTSVQAVVMSEGIYDIDKLLSSFPSYRDWFIEDAFGQRETFPEVSALHWARRERSNSIRWLVIHSKGDDLVDMPQSEAIYEHLGDLYGSGMVSLSSDEATEGHDELLIGTKYVEIVSRFLQGIS